MDCKWQDEIFFCAVVVFFPLFFAPLFSFLHHCLPLHFLHSASVPPMGKTVLSSVTSPTAGAMAFRVWSSVPSLIYHLAYGASCQGGTQFHNSHSRSGITSQLVMHSSVGWGLVLFYFFPPFSTLCTMTSCTQETGRHEVNNLWTLWNATGIGESLSPPSGLYFTALSCAFQWMSLQQWDADIDIKKTRHEIAFKIK